MALLGLTDGKSDMVTIGQYRWLASNVSSAAACCRSSPSLRQRGLRFFMTEPCILQPFPMPPVQNITRSCTSTHYLNGL